METQLSKIAEESARGSFFLISGTALSTVILAVTSIFVARLLGPELYGQYNLALVIPSILFLIADLGISKGIIKFTANFNLKSETDRIAGIVKNLLIMKALIGIVIFLINYGFAGFFALFLFQRPELTLYIQIGSVAVLFQVMYTTATSLFVGLDKTHYNAIVTNIQSIAKAIISISLVVLGFSLVGAMTGYVFGYVIATVFGILLFVPIIRNKNKKKKNNSTLSDLKLMISYSIPLYISILLVGFAPFYQSVILATFTTDLNIGNYRAATNFLSLFAVVAGPITTALLPAFSKLDSSPAQKVKDFFKLANKYTALIVIPITILIIILSKELVQTIYGSTYTYASTFLTIFCLLYFLVGVGYLILPSLYNGLGDTKTTLRMGLISFTILLFLSPLLTQFFSVQGLIAASIIATAAGTLYGILLARKRLQIEFAKKDLLKIYVLSAVSAIAPITIQLLPVIDLLKIIIGGSLYVLIYITLIPLTNTMTEPEIQNITKIVHRIRFLKFFLIPILKYQQKLYRSRRKLS
jgi:stage V sporulation protein B